MDMTGVMPTSPLKYRTFGLLKSMALNSPTGPCTASSWPSCNVSCSQLETLPPGTRLMVMEKLYGTDGELEMVYERMVGTPSISSSRVTNCPGLKKNRIGWSAMKQKVRTSQVSWITLTTRTRWRPLAHVWVFTGLRKLLDMLISTADCRPYVADSA